MKKILKNIFINNFKSIFYIIQNSKSNYLEFEKITFKLKKNSKLGKKNTYLSSRIDQIITPNIIRRGQWDYFIIKFIIKNLKRNKIKYSFFDIGANIGLITIQLYAKKLLGIKDFYCIEPEPTNFKILSENINSLNDKKIFKFNYALTNNKSGKKKIYLNRNNFGDFSLQKNGRTKFSYINSINANIFFKKITSKNKINNIVYKSDTQGLDEIIVLNLDKRIIDKISIMIIEISNFNYIKKNQTKFIKLIENFNIKEDENGKRITKNEIIEKLLEKNEFNLLLAKKK